MQLLDLPEEIILTFLSFLHIRDLLTFASTNHYFHNFFATSIRLQYIAELDAAGCLDRALDAPNPRPHSGDTDELASSIRERLEYLRNRKARWRTLDLLASAVSVPLAHWADVSVYDLSGGVFAFGENARETEFKYMDLREISRRSKRVEVPRKWISDEEEEQGEEGTQFGLPPTDVPWESYPFEGKLADFGLSLQEHDLVALITVHYEKCASGSENPAGSQTIKLHLNELSTRRPHPLAKDPLIVLAEKPTNYDLPSPMIEIAGEHIAILLNFPRAAGTIVEDLFVYNWKTGKLLQHQSYEWSQYSCLTFVTTSLYVLVNTKDNSLELIEILPASDQVLNLSKCKVRTLRLPELIDGFSLYTATCRGDPNPVEASPDRVKPKSDKADSASQRVPGKRWGAAGYGIFADPLRAIISFNLVINHQGTNMPVGPSVNFVLHRSALTRLAAECQGLPKGESPAAESLRDTKWEEWGPGVTRWRLEADTVEWVTTTAGQRQVFSSISADANWTSVIVVRDYNPYAVRRARALGAAGGVHVDSRDGVKAADSEEEEEELFEFDDAAGMIEGGFVEMMQTPGGFLFHAHVVDVVEHGAGEGANGENGDNEHDGENGDEEDDGENPNNYFALDAATGFHQIPPSGDPSHPEPDNGIDGEDNAAEHEANGINGDSPQNGDANPNTDPSNSSNNSANSPTPLKLISVRVRDTAAEFGSRFYKRGSLRGGLPCVEYMVAGREELYSGLLLDEERIIGYLEKSEWMQSEKMSQMIIFSMHP